MRLMVRLRARVSFFKIALIRRARASGVLLLSVLITNHVGAFELRVLIRHIQQFPLCEVDEK